MSSSHSNPRIVTLKATAAIALAYLAVKPGADNEHAQVAAAATDKIIGISQNAPTTADDPLEIALPGGGGRAKLGGSVSFGDYLTSDADGKLIATTTANDRVIAKAMSDGVLNDVIGVEVLSFNY